MSGLSSLKSLYPLTLMQSDPVFAVVPCPDISTVTLGVLGNFSLTAQRPHCPSFSPRMQRHADAIFTDNYRKFLGQISARKFLQTIIGKRLG